MKTAKSFILGFTGRLYLLKVRVYILKVLAAVLVLSLLTCTLYIAVAIINGLKDALRSPSLLVSVNCFLIPSTAVDVALF
jgi:hypothetical protein